MPQPNDETGGSEVPAREDVIFIPELEAQSVGAGDWRPWSDRDVAILRKYYGRVKTVALAAYMGRTRSALQDKAVRMSIAFSDGCARDAEKGGE